MCKSIYLCEFQTIRFLWSRLETTTDIVLGEGEAEPTILTRRAARVPWLFSIFSTTTSPQLLFLFIVDNLFLFFAVIGDSAIIMARIIAITGNTFDIFLAFGALCWYHLEVTKSKWRAYTFTTTQWWMFSWTVTDSVVLFSHHCFSCSLLWIFYCSRTEVLAKPCQMEISVRLITILEQKKPSTTEWEWTVLRNASCWVQNV